MFATQKIGNRKLYWLLLTGFFFTLGAVGHGAFIYDQQSATETTGGGGAVSIQSNQPLSQSFTAALSFAWFIRPALFDINAANGMGATGC
jgi:hypothetical protein